MRTNAIRLVSVLGFAVLLPALVQAQSQFAGPVRDRASVSEHPISADHAKDDSEQEPTP